jgi:hypothetical protein
MALVAYWAINDRLPHGPSKSADHLCHPRWDPDMELEQMSDGPPSALC